MRIIDSHYHWLPRSVFDALCERSETPRARINDIGGYDYLTADARGKPAALWGEWFDLDKQFEYYGSLGHDVSAVNTFGPPAVIVSDLPAVEGREMALAWNDEMAAAQERYVGRFWSTAVVPLADTCVALEILNHAILDQGLLGVSLPATVGPDARLDAARLEPFYARAEELGVPLFLHPSDAVFAEMLSDDYDGALHLSLGRVFEVSAAAARIVFSGILERHPDLKLITSHAGGDLPFQSRRIDKYHKNTKLRDLPSVSIRRMYTDTALPDASSIAFAIKYFGIDHVMYGTDYPCCMPGPVLEMIEELGLSDIDRQKLFYDNAVRILGLKVQVGA